MPSRFDKETRAKTVRLVKDHVADYESEWAAIRAIAARLGTSAETLRKWVRQAEVNAGQAPGVPTELAREIRHLLAATVLAPTRIMAWSRWRRHRQHQARTCHYRRGYRSP